MTNGVHRTRSRPTRRPSPPPIPSRHARLMADTIHPAPPDPVIRSSSNTNTDISSSSSYTTIPTHTTNPISTFSQTITRPVYEGGEVVAGGGQGELGDLVEAGEVEDEAVVEGSEEEVEHYEEG